MSESAKPLTVDGQTIVPKWAWSGAYRGDVRAAIKTQGQRSASDRHRALTDYVRAWAARRGLPCASEEDLAACHALIIEEQSAGGQP